MKKKPIKLNKKYSLDMGASYPIDVKTIEFVENGVKCKYLFGQGEMVEVVEYEIFEMNGYSKMDLFDVDQYDTVLKLDLTNLIDMFLGDLEIYCNDNNITLDQISIKKAIGIFKQTINPLNLPYYSDDTYYENLTNESSDGFFNVILYKLRNR